MKNGVLAGRKRKLQSKDSNDSKSAHEDSSPVLGKPAKRFLRNKSTKKALDEARARLADKYGRAGEKAPAEKVSIGLTNLAVRPCELTEC